MRQLFILLVIFFLMPTSVNAQVGDDNRPTIAVPMFKSDNEKHQKYLFAITAKVTEILNNSKRFNVVSRSVEDVAAERKFQKSEEFLDRTMNVKNENELKDMAGDEMNVKRIRSEVKEDGTVVFFGANYILQGEVRKLDIVKILNADNSTAGYKALLSIQLAVNTTETNTLTEAVGIDSNPISTAMFSPERAVDEAIKTLDYKLGNYFYRTFPLSCEISKMVGNDVIINVGSTQGARVGDKFTVVAIEELGNEKAEVIIGEIKIKSIASGSFSQCSISKGKNDIIKRFSLANVLKCTMIL